MVRAPIGQRIRKRRQEVALSQVALAARVDISPSYLNLIEHNKRAIGGALINRIAEALDLDSRALAGTEEARLIAELGEVAADAALAGIDLGQRDVHDIVAGNPKAARAMLALFRAYGEARMRSDLIGERLGEESFLAEASQQILALITTIRSYSEILKDYGDLSDAERRRFVDTLVGESERLASQAGDLFDFLGGRGARRPRPSPREEIEDFLADHANYFPLLERAADETGARIASLGDPTAELLATHLKTRHGVTIDRGPVDEGSGERYEAAERRFLVADTLGRGSMRFRLARLIGELEYPDLLDDLSAAARLSATSDTTSRLKRALANYFAGALVMPYAAFRDAAERSRHDIHRLGTRFNAGFEQVCHRLATLRRPGAEGVPLHFLRTDIAGNISKRFSASGLRLPRYGGACPRWIIHHAFSSPGRVVTQVARLPDGEAYLFIASTCTPPLERIQFSSHHAVMIGTGIADAGRFVYADGLDLDDLDHAVPVGVTCRQCSRVGCAQRAFDRLAVPGADDINGAMT
jgi:predicted transcriptional regulator/transcriptional regulator with XRE-family HTH domain